MNNNKKTDGDNAKTGKGPVIIFDLLGDYLEHLKGLGVSEIWLAAQTDPPVTRDVREDVYHIVLSALPPAKTEEGKKPKKPKALVYVGLMLWRGEMLKGMDQTALGPERFVELVEEAIAPTIKKLEAAEFTVKRGTIS